jgi:hypothetical protein
MKKPVMVVSVLAAVAFFDKRSNVIGLFGQPYLRGEALSSRTALLPPCTSTPIFEIIFYISPGH